MPDSTEHIHHAVTHSTIVTGKVLRHVKCCAWHSVRHDVLNYAIAIRLFRTVLRDRLKNFWRNNS